ncbi:MAG: efflux RND transporter periplasmic adaptor subunit [Desulfobacteraceae bacterium]|nr:efflux RND transporter periplasmic adaptor subunit [Desulfobacteraceae bacterium]
MRAHTSWNLLTLWFIILSFTFGATACGKGSQPKSQGPPTPEVVTLTVEPRQVVLTTELTGRTSAFRVAEIRPQVNGLIQKRLFVEGSDVKAGSLLYQIDPSSFQAALDNAKAALGRAEANLPAVAAKAKRSKQLLAEQVVSQQNYDDTDAALKQAEADVLYWKASVAAAEINLAHTRITAPISGRIGRSEVTEGALVTAYQPVALATIQQMDPIYVDVNQSTTELLRLKQRMEEGRLDQNGRSQNKVKLLLENGSVYPQEGALQFRDVTVEQSTGSVVLRVVFPNPQGLLLPGMFVRAVIQEGVNNQAILIPQQAVSRDPKGNPVVLVVDAESKAQQRLLKLDRAIDDQWLVSSGLAPGDAIVIEGLQKVRPGMAVKVASAAASQTPAPGAKPASTAPAAPEKK